MSTSRTFTTLCQTVCFKYCKIKDTQLKFDKFRTFFDFTVFLYLFSNLDNSAKCFLDFAVEAPFFQNTTVVLNA